MTGAGSPADCSSSRSPARPPSAATTWPGWRRRHARPTPPPAPSASRSTAARCPARPSRCSRWTPVTWSSASGSTASRVSGRPSGWAPTRSPTSSSTPCSPSSPTWATGASPSSSTASGARSTRTCSSATGRSTVASLAAGLRPHRPEVGEFVTSLDMAGLSLSLMVLDDELAASLRRPVRHPGVPARSRRIPLADTTADDRAAPSAASGVGGAASRSRPMAAGSPRDLLAAALEAVQKEEDNLGPARRGRRRRRPRPGHRARAARSARRRPIQRRRRRRRRVGRHRTARGGYRDGRRRRRCVRRALRSAAHRDRRGTAPGPVTRRRRSRCSPTRIAAPDAVIELGGAKAGRQDDARRAGPVPAPALREQAGVTPARRRGPAADDAAAAPRPPPT